MHPALVRYLFFPSIKFIQGRNVLAKLKELKDLQWLSPEEMRLLQLKRLRNLLSFAYENVPFYRRRLKKSGVKPDDIQKLGDLNNIPILTKKEIKSNLKELLALNCKKHTLIKSPTSGSTGEPAMFYMDSQAASFKEAARFLGLSWWGINIGDKEAMLWGSPLEIYRYTHLNAFLKKRMNHILLPSFDLSESKMTRYAKIIEKFKPDFIYTIASSLHVFANFLERNNINARDWNLKVIVSSAETLPEHERTFSEKVFGCKVIDEYGSREGGTIAYHCPEKGLHIFAPNVLVEFVTQGRKTLNDEFGEIIITRLDNYSMPLIRYQTGDVGIPSDRDCDCGRGLPLMEQLEGRVNDMIITPEGKYVTGSFIPYLFKNIQELAEYQVIQKSKTNLLIYIVHSAHSMSEILSEIEQKIKKFISENMTIEFRIVESIPRLRSNKRRLVISKIPAKLAQRFDYANCQFITANSAI